MIALLLALLAVIVATILLAGLCVWIISWNGDDEEQEGVEEAAEVQMQAEHDDGRCAQRYR